MRAVRQRLKRTRAEQARRSLAHFFRQSWEVTHPGVPLEWGPHLDACAFHLQTQLEERAVAAEWLRRNPDHVGDLPPEVAMRAQDLAIDEPPRTLKTSLATAADAWSWIRWPELEIFFLSANPRVPLDSAREFRDIIVSPWYRESFAIPWEIRADQDALGSIGNTHGGARRCRGITSDIVGEGCHVLRVDDPHDLKDGKDQVEQTVRHYKDAIANRVNDPRTSIRCLIMQRVSEVDLAGAEAWEYLVLPMEYEEDVVGGPGRAETCYGYRDFRDQRDPADPTSENPSEVLEAGGPGGKGTVLHPRFTPSFLAKEYERLGALGYAGQMQQRPAAAEGGTFKRAWFRFWRTDDQLPALMPPRPQGCKTRDELPARVIPCGKSGEPLFDLLAMTVDAAFKKVATGSRVSIQIWGLIGADRFLLLDSTKHRSFSETKDAIRDIAARYPRCGKKLIEDKANGPAIIDDLTSSIGGMCAVSPGADSKEARAQAAEPYVRGGNTYLPDGDGCLEDFVHEVCVFPNGAKDDRVDAMVQLLIEFGANPDAARALAMCAR